MLYIRGMNIMKRVYIVKFITALGLLAILSLQIIWLYNMYMLLWNDIKEKAEEQLWVSVELEVIYRVESMPDADQPREILSGPIEDAGNLTKMIVPLHESLIQWGFPIDMSQLDSIYTSKLKEQHIQTDIVLNHINMKDQSVIQSAGASGVSSLGAIKTEIIPIREDGSEGIQAVILNPYVTIFERMGLILIATALIMVFVAACIVYQIKVIFFQNKIAKLREDFSYAMVHDMKTPLSSIQLGLRLLYSNKQTGEKREKSFQIVEDEVAHLLALTNKVLTLSKMESGKLRLDNKKFRIAPVINDLIEKFSVKAGKETLFSTDIRQELVYGDEEFLKEAISNLIDNAIKYSGDSVRIDISVGSDDTYTWIRVKDNGFGISHQDQKKIFEKFERAAAIDRNRKGGAAGFGLGLNYVYRVAEAHGGEVRVFSIEGQSSEFTIYLPILIQTIETL